MISVTFDGIQTDERILARVIPHPLRKTVHLVAALFLGLFFTLVVINISTLVPFAADYVTSAGLVISVIVTLLWVFWVNLRESRSAAYITDRRVIRFEPVSPVLTTKRSLFWNEVLKAKAYSPNIFYKTAGIGNLVVSPHLSENEDILLRDISYAEDLANYIDKILYLIKNNPSAVASLKPFVAKPRGQRD